MNSNEINERILREQEQPARPNVSVEFVTPSAIDTMYAWQVLQIPGVPTNEHERKVQNDKKKMYREERRRQRR